MFGSLPLSGRKTYLTGAVAFALGVLGTLAPDVLDHLHVDADPGLLIFNGLGLIFLRGALKKGTGR
jgi:hypothetical protein